MTAKVAVGDDPGETSVAVHDTKTAEGLLGHDHDGLAHGGVGGREREVILAMHQVADEFQPGAELAAGMEDS